jgi:hypothetical protein
LGSPSVCLSVPPIMSATSSFSCRVVPAAMRKMHRGPAMETDATAARRPSFMPPAQGAGLD